MDATYKVAISALDTAKIDDTMVQIKGLRNWAHALLNTATMLQMQVDNIAHYTESDIPIADIADDVADPLNHAAIKVYIDGKPKYIHINQIQRISK